VLQGVDGIVFVADSHPAREQANRESLADLHEHLATLGFGPAQVARLPRVFQWNKRDVPAAVPVERLREALNPAGCLEFEAVASDGRGVTETLRAACKGVLARLSPPAPASTGAMARPPAPATTGAIAPPPASAPAGAPAGSA
jgi:hypothetical protein